MWSAVSYPRFSPGPITRQSPVHLGRQRPDPDERGFIQPEVEDFACSGFGRLRAPVLFPTLG
jgi:hypothetical protein